MSAFAELLLWFLTPLLALAWFVALVHAARAGRWPWVVGLVLLPPVCLVYLVVLLRERAAGVDRGARARQRHHARARRRAEASQG